jgi:hypothetical protein
MQIIENIRINAPSFDFHPHEAIPQKVCDEVNLWSPDRIFWYLKSFNEACKAAEKTVVVLLRLEYSSDPIGSLTKSPAMGKNRQIQLCLGKIENVMEHLYNYTHVRFIGYYDKPTHKIVEVDFYEKV